MAWQALPVQVRPVLPGTIPVLQWFAAERGFAGATHRDGPEGRASPGPPPEGVELPGKAGSTRA